MKRLVFACLALLAAPAWAQQMAPFSPSGPTVSLAATGSASAAQVQPGTQFSPNMRVYNSGAVPVFVACGIAATSVTVAAGMPIAPGTVEIIGCNSSHIIGITAGTAATLYLTPGAGM